MTVSSTRGTELTVDDIVRRGWQMSGLMPINQGTSGPNWTAMSEFGQTLLDTILDELQTEGVFARQVVLEPTSLTASDYTYTMNANVLDIVGDGMYIDADETDTSKASGETLVKQIDREAWHRISAKDSEGRPSLFFFDRSLREVKLWPIPDEAGTIRFQIHKLMSDAYEGGATLELRQFWNQYLIWELAHQIATSQSLPPQRCSYLRKVAKEKRDKARGYAHQRPPSEMNLQHRTPWSGRRR
jgi:hypothetical protein